jgi:2'-5' RNA ligase
MTSSGTVAGDGALRLFLALRLPDPVLDALVAWSEAELAGAGRIVPRDHLHVTLAFLGRRPAGELEDIVDALRAAATGTQELGPLDVRSWRETRSVGMVVLGDPSGLATRLAADLHERLEALGVYRPEARPWLPHVTVLRFRERPRLRPALPELGAFAPSDAAAFLSRLHPAGARYEVLETVPLGG